jgi:hypothetical protein
MADIADALTNSLSRNGEGGMLVPMTFGDGFMTAPGIAFSTEPSLGFWRAASKDLQVAVASQSRMRWTENGVDVWDPTVLPSGNWVALVSPTGLSLPYLKLTGGVITGNVQLNNGGAITQLGPTNAASNTTYNTDTSATYDTSTAAIPHIFKTGAVARFTVNSAGAEVPTGLVLTLWNPANNGFNQMFCGAAAANYFVGGTVTEHAFYTASVLQAAINATGLTLGVLIGTNRIDILGANNEVATYNDGMTVRSLNQTVWSKYGWAGINTVTSFGFAVNDAKIGFVDANGFNVLTGKSFFAGATAAISNVTVGSILGLKMRDSEGWKGPALYHNDAAQQSGQVVVTTSDPGVGPGVYAPGTIVLVRDA